MPGVYGEQTWPKTPGLSGRMLITPFTMEAICWEGMLILPMHLIPYLVRLAQMLWFVPIGVMRLIIVILAILKFHKTYILLLLYKLCIICIFNFIHHYTMPFKCILLLVYNAIRCMFYAINDDDNNKILIQNNRVLNSSAILSNVCKWNGIEIASVKKRYFKNF
jgi:hypothetical protein